MKKVGGKGQTCWGLLGNLQGSVRPGGVDFEAFESVQACVPRGDVWRLGHRALGAFLGLHLKKKGLSGG